MKSICRFCLRTMLASVEVSWCHECYIRARGPIAGLVRVEFVQGNSMRAAGAAATGGGADGETWHPDAP